MPCYFPLAGYYSAVVNETGRRSIVFDKRKSHSGVLIPIPCGECVGCRLVEARNWAIRCVHEQRCHSESSFITLTYDEEHLPRGGTLVKRHFQLFMKRLRKARGDGVRFFACGEYGDRYGRPHYHALLFGVGFPDRRPVGSTGAGDPLFRSAELGSLWPVGQNIIGEVTWKSASYVAKYCLKKVGKSDRDFEGHEREFRLMSRRPGIGSLWFDRFSVEAYRHDSVIMDAREVPVPRYYDVKFENFDPVRLELLKRRRRRRAAEMGEENSHSRRVVREKVALLNTRMFSRDVG